MISIVQGACDRAAHAAGETGQEIANMITQRRARKGNCELDLTVCGYTATVYVKLVLDQFISLELGYTIGQVILDTIVAAALNPLLGYVEWITGILFDPDISDKAIW